MPVEVVVPLDAALTADEPAPPRPPLRCTRAGEPTLCEEQLAAWLNSYDAALQRIRARMAEIRGSQPAEN